MNKLIRYITLFIIFISGSMMVEAESFSVAYCSEGNYIRKSAGSSEKLKDVDNVTIVIPTNHMVEILEEVPYGGETWYKVHTNYYSNNYTGYINSKYFKNKSVYNLDDNYMTGLRNQGFPETYIKPLAKLHALHPLWVFTPTKAIDWNASVAGEMYNYKYNLIQYTADIRLRSTENGAYSNGNYIPQDNGSWYAASKQTVMFYMDPRNWFYEKTMFMFESLNFNSAYQTAANTRNTILKGTFMDSDEYANMFYNAAAETNVSTFHLASRVRHEQGTSGSGTINMAGDDGKVYYNYFNIRASGTGSANIIANALITAKNNGWDTPQKSITGGARFLKAEYIDYGQNNVYFQKFNTINTNSYWHQYQQNVRIAPSESYSTYNAYNGIGVINSAINFIIPIYVNLPAETTLAITANSNNALKSLSVSNCELNPAFSSGTLTYICSVPNNVTSVNVSAEQASSDAQVSGKGTHQLNEGENQIPVIVTAANGDIKTYNVTVNRIPASSANDAKPDDVISKAGLNNNNSYITGIKYQRSSTNFINDLKATYDLAKIEYVKNANNSGEYVSTGDTVKVTINGQTKTYNIVIKGDVSGDGQITAIDYSRIKLYFLGKYTLTNAYAKASDVSGDGQITAIDYSRIKLFFLGKYNIEQ